MGLWKEFASGDVIAGYRILSKLGRGGTGMVYLAQSPQGDIRALKLSPAPGNVAPKDSPLQREIEVANLVQHPNMVRAIEIKREQGFAILVLEYVEGISLKEWLTTLHGPLDPVAAVKVVSQVLTVLEACHRNGIIHRDVKPSNVLLELTPEALKDPLAINTARAKLADFGACWIRHLDSGRKRSKKDIWAATGTPAYMSPEQFGSQGVAYPDWDIYSIGILLIEALTGKIPSKKNSRDGSVLDPFQTMSARTLGDDREEILTLLCAVKSRHLHQVIGKMVNQHPRMRFLSAQEARIALHEAVGLETPLDELGDLEWRLDLPSIKPEPSESDSNAATSERRKIDNFSLERRFADDGISELYTAFDTELQRKVCVAVLKNAIAEDRFLRGFKLAARVRHPNVVDILSWNRSTAERPAIVVTRHFVADTLEDRIATNSPMDEVEFIGIADQCLEALRAIHSEIGVHRDLNPANVLLTNNDNYTPNVLLYGFYLLKPHDENEAEGVNEPLTMTGQFVGTPEYASPEMIQDSKRVDARSDLYSLGCTLYYAWTKHTLNNGQTFVDIIRRTLEGTFEPPKSLRPDTPKWLDQFIMKLVARDPNDRFDNAEEARAHLLERVNSHARLSREASSIHKPFSRIERPRMTTSAKMSRARTPLATILSLLGGVSSLFQTKASDEIDPRTVEKSTRDSGTTQSDSTGTFSGDAAFNSKTVSTYYPAPIAVAYRRFYQQTEPKERLEYLFATVESIVRYLVAIGISDLSRRGKRRKSSISDAKLHDLFKTRPFEFLTRSKPMSMGAWIETLRETARAEDKLRNLVVPELREVCKPGSEVDIELLSEIVKLRNMVVHAGVAFSADEARELLRTVRPLVERLLERMRFLEQYPLGFVRLNASIQIEGADQRFYRLHSCMGSKVENTEHAFQFESNLILEPDVPFIASLTDNHLLYLWPLMVQRQSPITSRHTLYTFDSIPSNRHFLAEGIWSAIDARETWRERLVEGGVHDHGWMMERVRRYARAGEDAAKLSLARRLLPMRGGQLSGVPLGRYVLTAPIGHGGFGCVYQAKDKNGNVVAVKVLERMDTSDREIRRFRSEFEQLKRIDHPGIVQCLEWSYQIISGKGYPWFSMEYAEGGDLRSRLDERHRTSTKGSPWDFPDYRRQIVDECRQILRAVSHLHEQNVIHRDIKPSNILIKDGGVLKLTDFGLVKQLDPTNSQLMAGNQTSTGAVMGTRIYMAPEQEKGLAVDAAADVYSLGILLAEMAGGSRPTADINVKDGSTIARWLGQSELPGPLCKLISAWTHIVPERRPANAKDAMATFEGMILSQLEFDRQAMVVFPIPKANEP